MTNNRFLFRPARHAGVTAAFLAFFLGISLVAETQQAATALPAVRKLYVQAVDGNPAALKQSLQVLKMAVEREPDNQVVSAYLGSVLLLESSTTILPWKKGKLARAGLTRLDAAVAHAESNVEIRFLRAASSYHLPAFIGRKDQCAADLTWLSTRVADAVRSGALGRAFGAAALYYHGMLREAAGDVPGARLAWTEAAKLSPQTHAGLEAAKKVTELHGG